MQSLICKKPIFQLFPHVQPTGFFLSSKYKNNNFLSIHLRDVRYTSKTLSLCSNTSSESLNYGGWDDFQLNGASADSGESNRLHNFLNFVGIGGKNYAFVYLFGFVCALAFSRVKISSIIVFPSCAVVFALGFFIGLVKGGDLRKLKLNGNRRQIIDDTFRDFVEELKGFGDKLRGDNAKLLKLKNDIRTGVECNQVTVTDLEGYIDVLESTDVSFRDAIGSVESYVQSVLVGSEEKEGSPESSRVKKKVSGNGMSVPAFFNGLFGKKFDNPKNGEMKDSGTWETMGVELNNQKGENILASPFGERKLKSASNNDLDSKSASVSESDSQFDEFAETRTRAGKFTDEYGMESFVGENVDGSSAEKSDSKKADFDKRIYNYWNKTSKFVDEQEFHLEENEDEADTMFSQNSSYDSVNFSISMNHIKTAPSSQQQKRHETQNRNYVYSERTEDYVRESMAYSLKNERFSREKRPFDIPDSADENASDSPMSSMLDDDLEFERCLLEANALLNEAKAFLRRRVDDGRTERALQNATKLLSNAIEIRPLSLLAVGQLANTYLLHGELKLGTSRKLRSLLVKTDPLSVKKEEKILGGLDDKLVNKDKIVSALADVCEECEEILIKAGRKYKLAFSIDGNDMKTLYNWGLALSYRAQLIADIGPSAAADADKIFLAAIEKFDAIMAKSNEFAPDALYRWGAALQHRSRLRPGNSREKLKLLQQAKRFYEDALRMDSQNLQLQKAFSSCISELDYWYR